MTVLLGETSLGEFAKATARMAAEEDGQHAISGTHGRAAGARDALAPLVQKWLRMRKKIGRP